ncbi:hypothetical protein DPMN_098508 [Dreissena polymorpha]|uniref:Paraneoplastic antigen Ma-like C-terminal domain-containing protein n=1 Tax=Dreissena polymorpha TaxID=45954 RepID=A0A9D4LDU6_DREPO|nr:hypothetical protein DPMN_098508 [Dreissena polymorpha]
MPFMIKPNVPKFSDPAQFQEWKIEVESMLISNIYHKEILRQAIRNAIGGKPRKILTTLKPTATTEEILKTLESNFGDIKSGESLMEEYYKAKQEEDEDISAWGIRLEELLQKAIDRGEIKEYRKEKMLKTRFWKHLGNTELKNATRMFYESDCSFEELRRKVRKEEQELKSAKEPGHPKQVNVHQMDNHLKNLNDLKEQMKEMEKKINTLTQERQKPNDQGNTRTWNNSGQSYKRQSQCIIK